MEEKEITNLQIQLPKVTLYWIETVSICSQTHFQLAAIVYEVRERWRPRWGSDDENKFCLITGALCFVYGIDSITMRLFRPLISVLLLAVLTNSIDPKQAINYESHWPVHMVLWFSGIAKRQSANSDFYMETPTQQQQPIEVLSITGIECNRMWNIAFAICLFSYKFNQIVRCHSLQVQFMAINYMLNLIMNLFHFNDSKKHFMRSQSKFGAAKLRSGTRVECVIGNNIEMLYSVDVQLSFTRDSSHGRCSVTKPTQLASNKYWEAE